MKSYSYNCNMYHWCLGTKIGDPLELQEKKFEKLYL